MDEVFESLDALARPFHRLINEMVDEMDGRDENSESPFAVFFGARVHYYRSGRIETEINALVVSDLLSPANNPCEIDHVTTASELLRQFYLKLLPPVVAAIEKQEKNIGPSIE